LDILDQLMTDPKLGDLVEEPAMDTAGVLVNDQPRWLRAVLDAMRSSKPFKTRAEFELAVRMVFVNALRRWYLPHVPGGDVQFTLQDKERLSLVGAAWHGLDTFTVLLNGALPRNHAHMSVDMLKRCRAALDALLRQTQVPKEYLANYTRHPSRYPGTELPDYDNVIPEPMWLAEVLRKLETYEYVGPDDVCRDVHLLFQNIVDFGQTCYYPAPPGVDEDEFHQEYVAKAETLLDVFNANMRGVASPGAPRGIYHDDQTPVERMGNAAESRARAGAGAKAAKAAAADAAGLSAGMRKELAEVRWLRACR
jgi:hypothetical protein